MIIAELDKLAMRRLMISLHFDVVDCSSGELWGLDTQVEAGAIGLHQKYFVHGIVVSSSHISILMEINFHRCGSQNYI